jgi:hypothetical protein
MRTRLALIALALFLLPAVVNADPLVVTGGFAQTREGSGQGGRFSLTGENFVLNGGTQSGVGGGGRPVAAGQQLNFGITFIGTSDFSSGSAQFNGVSYPEMHYGGRFSIRGTLIVPLDAPSSGIFTVTAPFTFDANLRGCATNSLLIDSCQGGLVFDTTFVGQGIATVQLGTFISASGIPEYGVIGTTYQFTEPVPEPATLVLLSTGLAGVGGVARRRRKAKNRAA